MFPLACWASRVGPAWPSLAEKKGRERRYEHRRSGGCVHPAAGQTVRWRRGTSLARQRGWDHVLGFLRARSECQLLQGGQVGAAVPQRDGHARQSRQIGGQVRLADPRTLLAIGEAPRNFAGLGMCQCCRVLAASCLGAKRSADSQVSAEHTACVVRHVLSFVHSRSRRKANPRPRRSA